jgi:hypothetical protein
VDANGVFVLVRRARDKPCEAVRLGEGGLTVAQHQQLLKQLGYGGDPVRSKTLLHMLHVFDEQRRADAADAEFL